jgi:four helix bundle protein
MISVSCNIAEGTSRWSDKEKIRFIEIAYGSLKEVVNCLILSYDLEYITEEKLYELRMNIDIVAFKLNGLKKSFSANKP